MAERGDPLYVDVLKAHWVEEVQHVKSDALEIALLAREMSPEAAKLESHDDPSRCRHFVPSARNTWGRTGVAEAAVGRMFPIDSQPRG